MEVKGFQTSFEVFAEAGAAAAADHTLPRCSVTSLQMTRLIPHSFQTQLISASLSLLPTPPMSEKPHPLSGAVGQPPKGIFH